MNNQTRITVVLLLALHGRADGQSNYHTLGPEPILSENLDSFQVPEVALVGADHEVLSVPLPELGRLRPDARFQVQPLCFERNEGQVDVDARFLARGAGYHLFLTETEAVIVLNGEQHRRGSEIVALLERSVLRMRLVGANSSPPICGEEQLQGKVNYFIGNEPSLWLTNLSTYASVRYRDVYPGIDLFYYGSEGQLEYDFVLAPGADPSAIAIAIEGAEKLALDQGGDLIVSESDQEVRWRKPLIYQLVNGARHQIAGTFRVAAREPEEGCPSLKFVSFELAAYNHTQPLVIDPVLVYGTFLGGSDDVSYGKGIAVDHNENAYVSGYTRSVQFPTKNALQPTPVGSGDFFVTKLDSTGQIVYSTYLGGSGREADVGPLRNGIAVDLAGSVYVVGATLSTNFPVMNAVQPTNGGSGDAFIVMLSPTGSALLYSTYLGGSGNDYAFGVALDSQGNAHICGDTSSANFPITNAFQARYGGGTSDGFVAKLNTMGNALVYCSYFGGSNNDSAGAIAVDAQGNGYVGGSTRSADFPTKAPFQSRLGGITDGFFAKFGPEGALLFSSYFGGSTNASSGGSGDDRVFGIAVGRSGDVYLAGDTGCDDLPTTKAIQPQNMSAPSNGGLQPDNAFVTRYNPASNSLMFSTYLGGSEYSGAGYLTLDTDENVYVVGSNNSSDFPITADAIQPSFGGGSPDIIGNLPNDVFLSVLSSDGGTLIYSSYLGGSGGDQTSAVALDQAGNLYLTGQTVSIDFPVQNPILPYLGQQAAFVVKFSPIVVPPPVMQIGRSGTSVIITWPVTSLGFAVESMSILTPSNTWLAVTNSVITVADRNTVNLEASGSRQFYRLHKP